MSMHLRRLVLSFLLAAPAVFLPGCAVHASYGYGYRVYDPYYNDYHVWGPPEVGYYNQWVIDTHRHDREFRRLRPEDQRQYWRWRHDREHH